MSNAYYYVFPSRQNEHTNSNGREIWYPNVDYLDFDDSPNSANSWVGPLSDPCACTSTTVTMGGLVENALSELRQTALYLPGTNSDTNEYFTESDLVRAIVDYIVDSRLLKHARKTGQMANSVILSIYTMLSKLRWANSIAEMQESVTTAAGMQELVNLMNSIYDTDGHALQLQRLNKFPGDELWCIVADGTAEIYERLERLYRGNSTIYLVFTTKVVLDQVELLDYINKRSTCPRELLSKVSYRQYLTDVMSNSQIRDWAAALLNCSPAEIAVLPNIANTGSDSVAGGRSATNSSPVIIDHL